MDSKMETTQTILVDVASGQLLGTADQSPAATLEDFAAASPDLLSAVNVSWDTLFSALEAPPGTLDFQDVVLVSDRSIFVAQRLTSDPGLALLSIVPVEKGIGLALSEARSRVSAMLHPR